MGDRGELHLKVLELFGEPIVYGGEETFVMSFLPVLSKWGCEIDVLTPYSCEADAHRETVEGAGGELFELGLAFHPGNSRRNLVGPLEEFLALHPYDVVHIHTGSTSVMAIASRAAKRAKVRKVLVHAHAGEARLNYKKRLLRRLASFALSRYVDEYCTCSKMAAQSKFVSPVAENALVVHNGVQLSKYRYDADLSHSIRERLGIKETTFVLGSVGRLSSEKNQVFLADVFSEVLQKCPDSVLLLVGDGECREQVERRVAELGLEAHVMMPGSTAEPELYFQALDVFLFPSLREGLGIAAIEAQAAGVPVVASDRVPTDIKIAPEVSFLPLGSAEEWAEVACRWIGRQKKDNAHVLMERGYDSADSARVIWRLYQ